MDNLQIIKDFCKNYPDFINCTLQTFDDDSERDDSSLARKKVVESWWIERCQEKQKKGAWVFFSVNSMEKWERSKAKTSKIKTWIVEVDDISKEKQYEEYMNAPLKPSLLIESKKSLHAYFFAIDWDQETYTEITCWLKQYFGWDEKIVWDRSRVLRVPWFYHQKDEEDKFLVTVKSSNPERRYTKEQMINAFPCESVEEIKEQAKTYTSSWESEIRREMWSWDNMTMLDDISWTKLVNWDYIEFKKNTEWHQIIINWKSTSCWIDSSWMIWSSDWWGPTWIQRVLRYGRTTKSELVRFCIEKYPHRITEEMIEEERNKRRAQQQVKKEIMVEESVIENFSHIEYKEKILRWINELKQTNPRKIIKRWWDLRDDALGWIYTWKIYLIWAETWAGKSTFTNKVCENIVKQWHRVVKYSLEDRLEDKAKEELFFEVNRYRIAKWYTPYKRTDFYNNEYWHTEWKFIDEKYDECINAAIESLSKLGITELERKKQININELSELIKEEAIKWCKFFSIDHLHYFEMWKSERRDLEIQEVMHKLNDLVRDYNITIFLVAHYSNSKTIWDKPHPWMFKDGSAIKQVVNFIIQITSDEYWETIFHITKIRWPWRCYQIEGKFNVKTFEYDFTKSREQEEKEKDHDFKIIETESPF